MKRLPLAALLVSSTLAFSGCVDLSSPRSVLHSAFNVVVNKDVAMMKEVLDGKALARFGTDEGMNELVTRFADHEFYVTELQEVENDRKCDYCRETYEIHQAEIMGVLAKDPTRGFLMDAKIHCKAVYYNRSIRPTLRCKITEADFR